MVSHEVSKKIDYVITTGWWCKDDQEEEMRTRCYGDKRIRDKEFFSDWYNSVRRYADPKKILVVDSASPVKPELPIDPCLEWVCLDENAGHSTNHKGHWSGVTRAHILGMVYALACEVDYWVYIEQDALIYGEGIIEKCIEKMKKGVMLGSGDGTPQPIQQSLMIIEKREILGFISRLSRIHATDNIISPEMKFAIATSKILQFLPEFLFYENHEQKFYRSIFLQLVNIYVSNIASFDVLPIGYGRKRPIQFQDDHFYFQHGRADELDIYFDLVKR